MWNDTEFTRRLGIRYPIVQGPFGGGLSSPQLAAIVSNAGGLGSFGAQGMTPEGIRGIVGEIRTLTAAPYAVNLWVSTKDAEPGEVTREAFDAALAPLIPALDALGAEHPRFAFGAAPSFEAQAAALIEARPPVFSFVFGVPPAWVLDRCRGLGIRTMGAATTVAEARALADAGVDVVVATGAEAGGHRPSFLRSAESSLMGTLSLVPQVATAVRVPIVAAGGIADGRGVAAALALGAHGAQIGTAFLACDESNAHPAHRAALRAERESNTVLTRGFTGRLGRALGNELAAAVSAAGVRHLPYPYQGHLVAAIKQSAFDRGRPDLAPFWSGQSAPLIRHSRAADLFAAICRDASGARR
jgi:nitronate monooxygenase